LTLQDLSRIVRNAAWFSHVGEFRERADATPLATVAPSEDWDWLPSSTDQTDPIYGEVMVEAAERLGKAAVRRDAELFIAKEVQASLRPIREKHPGLIDGPHDFTLAAKGGARYAARMAAREIVAGRPGFWCRVISYYGEGFWPCGFFNDGRMIVVH